MLTEVYPDILVCFGLAMPHLYGLCVDAATLREFNHRVSNLVWRLWLHDLHLDALWGTFGPPQWCGASPLSVGCNPLYCGGGGGTGRALVGLVYHTISWVVLWWWLVRHFQIFASPCMYSSFPLNGILDWWLVQTSARGRCAHCGKCLVGPSLLAIIFLRVYGWCRWWRS